MHVWFKYLKEKERVDQGEWGVERLNVKCRRERLENPMWNVNGGGENKLGLIVENGVVCVCVCGGCGYGCLWGGEGHFVGHLLEFLALSKKLNTNTANEGPSFSYTFPTQEKLVLFN